MADNASSSKKRPPEMGNTLQCAACAEERPFSKFSKSQKAKGSNRRCQDCVQSNKPIRNHGGSSHGRATTAQQQPPANKKPKLATLNCQKCQKSKKVTAFPRDHSSDNPICVECILDSVPRTCKDCGKSKPKDQYSAREWRLPEMLQGNRHSKKTTLEIQQMPVQVQERVRQQCLDCEKDQREKEEKEAREKEEKDKRMMKKYDIQFYDVNTRKLQFSKTKPKNLVGVYDMIFHSGFCQGEFVESRTTQGTAKLEGRPSTNENLDGDNSVFVSGLVEFVEDLRMSPALCFQRDFTLSDVEYPEEESESDEEDAEEERKSDEDAAENRGISTHWKCDMYALLADPEALEVVTGGECEPAGASLRCIEKRAAFPWMKYEYVEQNEAEDDMIKFETLEQAQVLAEEYEKGLTGSSSWMVKHLHLGPELAKRTLEFVSHRPKPVFFLEPGDLLLTISWTADVRESIYSELVLRKRT